MELIESLGLVSSCSVSTAVLLFLGAGLAYWLHEKFKKGGN